MKLSKRHKEYMKIRDYKLKPRTKPLTMPHQFFPDERISFSTWLLQRLERKVWKADSEIKEFGHQYYGWGGGGSGLTSEELTELNKIFQFHYMGAAEYEFGALAKSYRFLQSHQSELVYPEITLFGQTFYVACLNYHEPFMAKALEGLIVNNQFPMRLSKEDLHLHKVIQENDKNFVGAWSLNSHYLFFTNKARFLKLKKHLKASSLNSNQKVA